MSLGIIDFKILKPPVPVKKNTPRNRIWKISCGNESIEKIK